MNAKPLRALLTHVENYPNLFDPLTYGAFYTLTPEGRASLTLLLGLPAESARLTPEEADDA